MSRSHITVRAAGASDVADLVVLWDELKRCGAFERSARDSRRRPHDRRASASAAQPSERSHPARLPR